MTTRTFALVVGFVFFVLGLLGFVPAFLNGDDGSHRVEFTVATEYLFAMFATNYFMNLVHIAVGAWGISASRAAGGSRAYTRTLAVIFGALAIIGLVPTLDTFFGFVPLHGNNVWLHGITALAAAFVGWAVNYERPLAARTARPAR
jgi:hypothetical protein